MWVNITLSPMMPVRDSFLREFLLMLDSLDENTSVTRFVSTVASFIVGDTVTSLMPHWFHSQYQVESLLLQQQVPVEVLESNFIELESAASDPRKVVPVELRYYLDPRPIF
jgi:hypothetical protein